MDKESLDKFISTYEYLRDECYKAQGKCQEDEAKSKDMTIQEKQRYKHKFENSHFEVYVWGYIVKGLRMIADNKIMSVQAGNKLIRKLNAGHAITANSLDFVNSSIEVVEEILKVLKSEGIQKKIASRICTALEGNGQCFPRAFHLQDNIGGLLCQGQVQARSVPQHCHAWVEKGDNCFDDSLGKLQTMPKEVYYALGNVKEVYRYTKSQTNQWAVKTGHFGPWEGREACPSIIKKRRGNIMKLGESALKIAKRLVADELSMSTIIAKYEDYMTEKSRYRAEKDRLLEEVEAKLKEMGLSESNVEAYQEYKATYKEFYAKLTVAVDNYFRSKGHKIKISDSDALVECYVIIGNQFNNSKVSFHLRDGSMGIMFRNNNTRNDIKSEISSDATVSDVIKMIDNMYRNGFWN